MKFKEWYKNKSAEENAPALEKIARERLQDVNNGSALDSIDPEFREWLLSKYPKTNDDSLAEEHAFRLLTEGYGSIEKEERNDAEIQKTIDLMYKKLLAEYEAIQEYKKKHLVTSKKLFDFIQERKKHKAMTGAPQQYIMSSDSEFYGYDSNISTMSDQEYRDQVDAYKKEIDDEAEVLRDMRESYARASERFNALTRQSEDHIERFERDN